MFEKLSNFPCFQLKVFLAYRKVLGSLGALVMNYTLKANPKNTIAAATRRLKDDLKMGYNPSYKWDK